MFKDYLFYIFQCFKISIRPAWRQARSFIGNIAVAIISIVFAGYIKPYINSLVSEEDMQGLIAWIIYIAVAAFCFWFIRAFFVAPFILWREQKQKLAKFGAESENATFNWSAQKTAEYIMSELDLDLGGANEFVKKMAIEDKMQIRAIRFGESIQSVVDSSIFLSNDTHNQGDIHLKENPNNTNGRKAFDTPYHENGWIQYRFSNNLNHKPLFTNPRFMSKQVKSVVQWYKESQADSV